MPARAPPSSETSRSCRGRPPRKARLHAVCHCQVRKGEGCCARSSKAFQRDSSTASKPVSVSTFIGPSSIREAFVAASEVPKARVVFTRGFVHGLFQVVAEVLAHLLTHALDEARDAGGVVLVEVSQLGRVGGGFESGVFGLGGGESRHEAEELCAATARTSGVTGGREGAHEQTHPPMAALAVVLVDGHARSSRFPALEMPHPSTRLQGVAAAPSARHRSPLAAGTSNGCHGSPTNIGDGTTTS